MGHNAGDATASVTPMANELEDFSLSLGSGLWTGCRVRTCIA